MPGERERRRERRQQSIGDGQRILRVVELIEQDDELVAAQPGGAGGVAAGGDAVAAPQRLAQSLGNLLEQLVAHLVSQAIVDQLEAVEVQIQDGRRVAPVAVEHRLDATAN